MIFEVCTVIGMYFTNDEDTVIESQRDCWRYSKFLNSEKTSFSCNHYGEKCVNGKITETEPSYRITCSDYGKTLAFKKAPQHEFGYLRHNYDNFIYIYKTGEKYDGYDNREACDYTFSKLVEKMEEFKQKVKEGGLWGDKFEEMFEDRFKIYTLTINEKDNEW